MNTTELTSLLKNPNIITHSQCSELESVLKEYPYFQSARSLYLKGLHIQDSFKYNAALKLTAAHTTDRTILFDFITNKNFAQERNFEVITPTIHSKFSSSDKINEAIESVSQINEAYTKEELELTKKNTSSNDSINLETEIQNSNVTDEEKLEQSVLNSIIIANETIEDSNNNTITEESISLENPLEKSILSSISESDQSINNKIEIPSSHTPSIREKVSWLEDIIDLDQKHEIEINLSEPIILNDNKTLSFQEWLLLSKTTPIERPENIITVEKEEPITKPAEENITNKISISDTISKNSTTNEISNTTNKKEDTEVNSKMDLIDKFIHNNPKISPPKDNIPAPSYISKKNDSPYLMTETLAKIYLEQKKYTKAIQAYEILILKYPEKSSLFADRILDIKDLQQNNNR
ncbi:hypothetical protein AX766_08525 [Flavobacterium covae]|uniref:Tetratricopeptide repeat protein n=2 Tax=Flavobacterium TaxID=237 RepID=A0AA94JPY1_9FLAO|nr:MULTISPECIES: tetratricopeptide repeat protein [Flavobacterium]AND64455.1 hypothetical protein AX766_08525 [Flavobacterium covae]MCH4829208.1 hypothetical protein [Flavobacterium columnare]MCH4833985.1 hypothetical protein [Flavobacterium columnare]MCJ1807470.1 hypothetical protein [Flavobacterium covae]OWP81972.1 hypothetical protein BWK63_03230 [Flavobacterium covae]